MCIEKHKQLRKNKEKQTKEVVLRITEVLNGKLERNVLFVAEDMSRYICL